MKSHEWRLEPSPEEPALDPTPSGGGPARPRRRENGEEVAVPVPPEEALRADARPAAHLVSLTAPGGFEAEQYRILRHTVEQRRQRDGLRVVAVTSPGGGEGKTTTAINLAGALAQAPASRVLLLEADLRRPTVLSQLGASSPSPGLAEAALDARLTLARITLSCPQFNLYVVPAGLPPVAPYEVLRTARVGQLLAEARLGYDYVVLDTPPVVPCPDYRVLEPYVDGVLLVVAADRTPRETMESSLELLDPRKILGLVFNDERRPSRRYRGYYDAAGAPSRFPFRSPWPSRSR